MNKQFFILLAVLFSFIKLNAQDSLPPVFEITTDTAITQNLDNSYWQVLADKDGKWSAEQVKELPIAAKFHTTGSLVVSKDNITHTNWIRYRLRNAMNKLIKISLDAWSEQDDFYVFDENGHALHFLSGTLTAWQKKDGLKLNNYVPITIEPGKKVIIYDRSQNKKPGLPAGFGVDIGNTEKIIQRDYIGYVENSGQSFGLVDMQNIFLTGMLFLGVFFNLAFFVILKEKEYLYFSLFLFALCITRMLNPVANYLYFNNPGLSDKVGYFNFGWSFVLLFLIQFIRYFFKVSDHYPRLSKFLLTIGYTYFIYNILCEFAYPDYLLTVSDNFTLAIIGGSLIFTICFSIIVIFLLYAGKKNKFNRLIIAGGFPLVICWATVLAGGAILNRIGAQSPNAFLELLKEYYWLIEIIAITCFLLCTSLVLFLRFNALRKENAQQALDKERLAKEKEIERNELIELQKNELEKKVEERTAELKQSLEELTSTQKQLIQSEKMASLGELTAGIAHEIQNPLNFVNNFSEVNAELIEELKGERQKAAGERNTVLENEILNDIEENEKKINHHGKRADAIVKGMLQHSRSSTGAKELTDINALADEYLRLSYHGLRAKDKNFNAIIKTDFDEAVRKINIIPQDIGRVLLNLYNNAFYAVNEMVKAKGIGYEPAVSVFTKKLGNEIAITVSDNGNGIPQKIVDKIFQPFFTTKPTGEGTGLGLSLSYDIIKAHGGEIKVETKEGEGTTFVIHLPV